MKKPVSLHQLYAKPIVFVGVLLSLAGIYSYTRMQTNLFPEVLFPRITVIADAGQQPEDRMMITVTKPLESAVKKVQGTTVVKSSTSRGSCVIDVYFNWGLDIYALKTQLESRINEIKNFLPAGTVISTEAMNQSLFPVYGFTLESDTHSHIALRDVGNLVVRPMFSQVKGISNVVVRGGKAKEFVVKPDAWRMSALGITPAQIKAAFAQTNFVLGNGNVADYNRLYLSLTDTRIDGLEELRDVIIRNDGERVVRLRDFAEVEIQGLRHRASHPAQADDRHRGRPCLDAPGPRIGDGRADAAAVGGGGDRRICGGFAPVAVGVARVDEEDLFEEGRVIAMSSKFLQNSVLLLP